MALLYQPNGKLVAGIYLMTWEDFILEFGFNEHRLQIIYGLKKAIADLKSCGCSTVYLDGSFTTKKPEPKDIDACYSTHGMDFKKLFTQFPHFFDFSPGRLAQKTKYKGEFFPMNAPANPTKIFIDFFQEDRDGFAKGIVQLNI